MKGLSTRQIPPPSPTFLCFSPTTVVYARNRDPKKVSIVCGGGSGHEPAHAAFVGDGLLTAAVCGNVFASPNVGQIRRAIELVGSKDGAG